MPTSFLRSRDYVAAIVAGCGSSKVAYRALAAGWITPVQRRANFVLYPNNAAELVLTRLAQGEYPPPLPCELRNKEKRGTGS